MHLKDLGSESSCKNVLKSTRRCSTEYIIYARKEIIRNQRNRARQDHLRKGAF